MLILEAGKTGSTDGEGDELKPSGIMILPHI